MKIFLTDLEQRGIIKFWDDNQLIAGVPWEKQISDVLDASKAGLLLFSQNFLASKFVKEVELPKLLEASKRAGKPIFWLPLSPSTVFDSHKEIAAFQSLLVDPSISLKELAAVEQDKVLVEVRKKLEMYAAR